VGNVVIDALSLGSVYGFFALGLTLVWSVLGLLNLAYGVVYMLGAYMAYVIATHTTLPLIPVILLAVFGTATLSALSELLVFRRIRLRTKTLPEGELAMLVASIGLAAIAELIVQKSTQGQTVEIPTRLLTPSVYHLSNSVTVTNLQVIAFVVTVVLSSALMVFMRRTRYGRAIRTVAYDADTAGLLGINSNLVFTCTMALSGALAGLAGVLLGMSLDAVNFSMGDPLLLKAFAVIIVGGIGSIAGAMAGGFLLALIETLIVVYGPSGYSSAAAFLVIFVVLVARPNGLVFRASQRV
jgi:branched-chain amino acid transport system permease protein